MTILQRAANLVRDLRTMGVIAEIKTEHVGFWYQSYSHKFVLLIQAVGAFTTIEEETFKECILTEFENAIFDINTAKNKIFVRIPVK